MELVSDPRAVVGSSNATNNSEDSPSSYTLFLILLGFILPSYGLVDLLILLCQLNYPIPRAVHKVIGAHIMAPIRSTHMEASFSSR